MFCICITPRYLHTKHLQKQKNKKKTELNFFLFWLTSLIANAQEELEQLERQLAAPVPNPEL